jgi:hypothetical protein
MRVPLIQAYKSCPNPDVPAPNMTHVGPLAAPACSPPVLESAILTAGRAGLGYNVFRLDVFCTDGDSPPCTPNDGNDTEDVRVAVTASDVRCSVGGIPNCANAGDDYTGVLVPRTVIRITDHLSGDPQPTEPCANGSGNPPCTTATVQDLTFGAPMPCVDNGANGGSVCTLNTTIDSLLPNTVIEFQRGVVEIKNMQVLDAGPDGSVTPPLPFQCPPSCGSGDETKWLEQGDFYA